MRTQGGVSGCLSNYQPVSEKQSGRIKKYEKRRTLSWWVKLDYARWNSRRGPISFKRVTWKNKILCKKIGTQERKLMRRWGTGD